MARRRGLGARLRGLAREAAKFGAVGAIGFLVNIALFNLCIHTFQWAPIRSGVLAQTLAIGANYLGNRYWTYRHVDKSRVPQETSLFFLFSGIALVLENGVLALSHYGLDYTTPLADNIAKNVLGLGLGTLFRFWSYRTWVFKERGATPPESAPWTPSAEGEAGEAAAVPAGVVGATASRAVGVAAEEESEDRRQLL